MAACFSDAGTECGSSLAVAVDDLRPSSIVIFVAESFSSDSLPLTHLLNEREQLFTAESTYQHGAELGPVQQRAQQSVKCSAFSSKLSNSSVGIFGGRRRLTRPLFGCGVT